MTQDNENRYRQKGEFEISGVEPLPQIETTGLGKEKLKGWGMTDEQIEDLGSFSSQFRYDRCAEKIARLSQSNAEVFTSESEDRVNLPKFYDIDGRLDGQCGDIGKQWIIKINESELMVSLNTNRKDGKQIVTCFYTGLSETHFCNEGSNHVWNGLALVNKDGDIEDEVYINHP